MREMHLFAGAGGGILAGLLLGHRPVCAVEIDDYCRRVLRARQADGWLPAEMEIHDDVTTFDGKAWQGRVDLVAGGFPCQDLSLAGKGAGLDGKRSGLWFEMLRVIREVEPRYVYVENVPAITGRGMDRVLGSLAEAGWDAEWLCLPASAVGAAHRRDRWWCLARNADYESKAAHTTVSAGTRTEHRRDSAAVPDSSSGQDHGRGRAELESATRAGQGLDASTVAGGAHDPDADGGRCEEQRIAQHDDQCSAPRRVADGLRAGRQGNGTIADTDDESPTMRRHGQVDAQGMAGGSLESRGSQRDSGAGCPRRAGHGASAATDTDDAGRAQQRQSIEIQTQNDGSECGDRRQVERGLGRVADGVARWLDLSAAGFWDREWETEPRLTQGQADRVARLRAIGNGQVPQCAAAAFLELWRRMHA